MSSIQATHITKALQTLIDETFNNVHGLYLDKNTSLFETLANITAEAASIPVGGKCASLAAQVSHVSFYLEVVEKSVRHPTGEKTDWDEIWRSDKRVSADEWETIQSELRINLNRIMKLIEETPALSNEGAVSGAIAVIAHTAYHLGEIRQALCFFQD
jgi:hypothetical protein